MEAANSLTGLNADESRRLFDFLLVKPGEQVRLDWLVWLWSCNDDAEATFICETFECAGYVKQVGESGHFAMGSGIFDKIRDFAIAETNSSNLNDLRLKLLEQHAEGSLKAFIADAIEADMFEMAVAIFSQISHETFERCYNEPFSNETDAAALSVMAVSGQLHLLSWYASPETIDTTEYEGATALMHACHAVQNRLEVTRRLVVDYGADVNARDAVLRATALHYATTYGLLDTTSLLLDLGANLEAEDDFRQTALMKACISGNLELIDFLIKRGANYKNADLEGANCFLLCAIGCNQSRCLSVLGFLFEKWPGFIATQDINGRNALHHVAARGDAFCETAAWLIDKGCFVDEAEPVEGSTALMLAAARGSLAMVAMLLAKGADRNLLDASANSAMALAIQAEHGNVVELLRKIN